jgi:threonine/homoserine efflux transporter RhtA
VKNTIFFFEKFWVVRTSLADINVFFKKLIVFVTKCMNPYVVLMTKLTKMVASYDVLMSEKNAMENAVCCFLIILHEKMKKYQFLGQQYSRFSFLKFFCFSEKIWRKN